MELDSKLKKLKIVMVSHIFVSGAFLALEEFLKTKIKTLLFIGHPFSFRKEINSFYRYYSKGKLTKEYKAFAWRLPEFFLYLKDAFYTFYWIITSKEKFDLYLGADNFDAYLGLWLKKIGKVKEVIFYTIDYMPKRFKNPLLNTLYHYFDRQCLHHCKIVWNISPKMNRARKKNNLKNENYVKQIVVPQGIWHKRIPKIPLSKKEKYQIVFLGHLVQRQGIDLVIEAIEIISKELPEIKLLIIGTGSYENYLKTLVREKKLEKFVTFDGYIEKDEEIEKKLAKSTLAVAMYKPDKESLTYFADPGKIKNYLSAGLPIILTDVPPIAKELVQKECALISRYEVNNLVKHLLLFLENRKMLEKYRSNAISFASRFDYNSIYSQAFSQSLD